MGKAGGLVGGDELCGFVRGFAFGIEGVDLRGRKVGICLAVHHGLHGQAVGERRLLDGIADDDGGYGHDVRREMEDLAHGGSVVIDRAEVADAQAVALGGDDGGLGGDDGIDGGGEEAEEVVISGLGSALAAPEVEAVEVGAEGEVHGCGFDHWLAEMSALAELGAEVFARGDDDAVYLHVAGVGRLDGRGKDVVEDIGRYGIGAEAAY